MSQTQNMQSKPSLIRSEFPSKISYGIKIAQYLATERQSNNDVNNMPRGTNHVAILLHEGNIVATGYNHMRFGTEPVHAEQHAMENFIQSRFKQYQRCYAFSEEKKPQYQKHFYKDSSEQESGGEQQSYGEQQLSSQSSQLYGGWNVGEESYILST